MDMPEEEQPVPRFLADHMLIRLGTYLRILGYDTTWHPGRRTHDLIRIANREGRVFLTANRHLAFEYPVPDRAVVLTDPDPVRQFRRVVDRLRLRTDRLFRMCIRCNCTLTAVADREAVRDRVPPRVFAAFRQFYVCPACGTVFWRGSHVANTCRKLNLPLPDDGRGP